MYDCPKNSTFTNSVSVSACYHPTLDMSCLRVVAGFMFGCAALVLIGFSFEKFLAKKRGTFSYEVSLGPRMKFPNVGVCIGIGSVLKDGKWVKQRKVMEGVPLLGKAVHAVYEDEE